MTFQISLLLGVVSFVALIWAVAKGHYRFAAFITAVMLLSWLGVFTFTGQGKDTQRERARQDRITFDRHMDTPVPERIDAEPFEERMTERHDSLRDESEELFNRYYGESDQ